MALSKGRERRRVVLREAILDSARTIVREGGLHSLTMRRIAEAIDYAPASLYAHFKSRESLLSELCREGLAGLRLALERGVEGRSHPVARLLALATAYVDFAIEHPDAYRLIFMEDPAFTKGVFESLEFDDGARALALIIQPLNDLHAAGALVTSAAPTQLADLFWCVVHGIASLRLACPALPATNDATLIRLAVEMLTCKYAV